MICLRCGSPNLVKSNRCTTCDAVLPRNFGQEQATTGLLSLEDGREYDPPDRVYANTALQNLEDAISAYLEESSPEDPIFECLDELERRIAQLLDFMPQATDAIRQQQEADPDDMPHKIGYLLQVGIHRFNDATQALRVRLENCEQHFDELLDELQLANDYICHAASLIEVLFARDGCTVQLELEEEIPSTQA